MTNRIELPANWVCTGTELKPKNGATSANTWVMSGDEIKPKAGALSSNTWIWTGRELLCSDGLTEALSDQEITTLLVRHAEEDLRNACKVSRRKGGTDDFSVIVLTMTT